MSQIKYNLQHFAFLALLICFCYQYINEHKISLERVIFKKYIYGINNFQNKIGRLARMNFYFTFSTNDQTKNSLLCYTMFCSVKCILMEF